MKLRCTKCWLMGGFAAMSIWVLFFSGCASTLKPALTSYTPDTDLSGKAVCIFSLKTSNQYKPNYQPFVRWVEIVSTGAKSQKYQPGDPYNMVKDEFNEYLVSVYVEPGEHTIGRIFGNSSGFLIAATFDFAVNAKFSVEPGGVVYLGHISMINRQRVGDEPRSGSVIPLIDQAAAGYSGGTFDVEITDRSETDLPDFIAVYPNLSELTIDKVMMTRN